MAATGKVLAAEAGKSAGEFSIPAVFVRKVGYVPDAPAQALRSGSTKTIDLIIADIHNPHFWQTADGVEQEAYAAGYPPLGSSQIQMVVPTAADNPILVRTLPPNSWGGAAQSLTALRAPAWLEHYGKPADLAHLMQRWVEAISRAPNFMQQMDPGSGEFSTSAGYSPTMCVFIDFVDRLNVLDRAPTTQAGQAG